MSQSIDKQQTKMDETAICTLFEGDYHLGLAALVNSLAHAGYKGTVWAGYRGALPRWIGQLRRVASDRADAFEVVDGVRIGFLQRNVAIHFTNDKPAFMRDLLANEARDCSYLWYFDPDICLTASWDFFRRWQRHGIALCQEVVDNIFPADSPLRKEWIELASSVGFADPRPLHHYYNAGMVGVPSAYAEFLTDWARLIELAKATGSDLNRIGSGNRERPFDMSDQDPLNVAAMYTKFPLTTLGPQGMGFIYGASMMMDHAVGPKPWRGSFLLRSLRGIPPSGAMKSFLKYVNGPIRAYPRLPWYGKRMACLLATGIGRFYRRL